MLGCSAGAVVAAWAIRRRRDATASRSQRSVRDLQAALASADGRLADVSSEFDLLVDVLDDGFLIVDANNRIARSSPRVDEWFGAHDVAAGRDRVSLMAALRSAEIAAAVEDARTGEPAAFRLHRGDRVLQGRVVADASGRVAISLNDVTQIERLSRARRDLVANVSHDLRTPLSSISLLTGALASGGATHEAPANVAAKIAEQVATLTAIADGILDLERLESGQAIFRLEPVILSHLIQQAVTALQPQLDQAAIRVVVDGEPGVTVLADAPQVLRALSNVLDNAARHSPRHGVITVSVARDPDQSDRVEVRIRDAGPGFAPSDLHRVFERFYRSDRARASKGAGLGLAIARHIVEGHGGSILAENAPDGGASVSLSLPLA